MPGQFVVEAEAGPIVTDRDDAAFEADPFERTRHRVEALARLMVGRAHGIHRQQMLDVGEHQLLVLLLVLQAELDQFAQPGIGAVRGEQGPHPRIDMLAIGAHLGERGAGEKPPLWPRILVPDRVVVRVEEHAEFRPKGFEVPLQGLEHEDIEEP